MMDELVRYAIAGGLTVLAIWLACDDDDVPLEVRWERTNPSGGRPSAERPRYFAVHSPHRQQGRHHVVPMGDRGAGRRIVRRHLRAGMLARAEDVLDRREWRNGAFIAGNDR